MKTIFLIFCFAIIFFNLACNSTEQASPDKNNITVVNNFDTEKENSELLNSSLTFNESGYELPDLTGYELSKKNVKLDIKSPKPVYVNTYYPRRNQLLQTKSLGKVRVLNVREY